MLSQHVTHKFASQRFSWVGCAAIGMAVVDPSGLLHREYCLLGRRRNESREKYDRLNHHFQAGLKPIERAVKYTVYRFSTAT